MRTIITATIITALGISATGCAGGGDGPGYLFQIIFIVLPMLGLGILILRKSESTNDSLYILEGQLKRLSSKLDNLEDKVASLDEKGSKGKPSREEKK